jgi:hypothetical protein
MQEKELLTGKELLRHICLNGTPAEKRALFEFGEDSVEKVLAKFQLFSRTCFSRYYQHKSAPFHKTMAESYLRSYILGEKRMELGFRGCGKTALLELVIVFVLLNDTKHRRRYIKILSRDLKNSVKLVTGVYNKLIELEYIYGDVFANEGKKKQEERQDAFLMQKGVQVSAGTVGMAQRGHKQDAYRPDWIVLEDIEDRTSVSSQAITTTVIENIGEALDGIAIGGAFVVNGNYISEDGVIEWLKRMSAVKTNITPIMHPGGEPTWSAITREHVAELKSTSLDFVGEYLCIKPETLILTPDGYKPINKIKVGDYVISHTGRKQKVLKVFGSQAQDLLDITVQNKTVSITKNHPVLVDIGGKYEWIEAGQLTEGDLVVVNPSGNL